MKSFNVKTSEQFSHFTCENFSTPCLQAFDQNAKTPTTHFVPTPCSSLAGCRQSHPAQFKKWFCCQGNCGKVDKQLNSVWKTLMDFTIIALHLELWCKVWEVDHISIHSKPIFPVSFKSANNEVLSERPVWGVTVAHLRWKNLLHGWKASETTSPAPFRHLSLTNSTIFVTFRNKQVQFEQQVGVCGGEKVIRDFSLKRFFHFTHNYFHQTKCTTVSVSESGRRLNVSSVCTTASRGLSATAGNSNEWISLQMWSVFDCCDSAAQSWTTVTDNLTLLRGRKCSQYRGAEMWFWPLPGNRNKL